MTTLFLWIAFVFILVETFLFIYLTYLLQQNNLLNKALKEREQYYALSMWSSRDKYL